MLESQEKQAAATLKAQQAARDLAAINLGYTRITAPVDGMVGQRQVGPGQYLSVGTQVNSRRPRGFCGGTMSYKGSISAGDSESAKRQAFGRAAKQLTSAKKIGVWDSWVWVVDERDIRA